jgi:hypothetical protein
MFDPMENLRMQRKLTNAIIVNAEEGLPIDQAKAVELAEHVLRLDEWRKEGGYDPYMKERRENDPNYRR